MASRITTTSAPQFHNTSDSNTGAYTSEQYQRKADHTARTSNPENEESYILAVKTDHEHHKRMTALRNEHFPPKINKLEAHVAIFRALPGSELPRIVSDITSLVATIHQPFDLSASSPFRLSHGVGIRVHSSPILKSIHEDLKGRWEPFLSKQDMSFKAHYTIQNKVDDDAKVKDTLEKVNKDFHGCKGKAEGLTLYRYDRGFWKKERSWIFGESSDGSNHYRDHEITAPTAS